MKHFPSSYGDLYSAICSPHEDERRAALNWLLSMQRIEDAQDQSLPAETRCLHDLWDAISRAASVMDPRWGVEQEALRTAAQGEMDL